MESSLFLFPWMESTLRFSLPALSVVTFSFVMLISAPDVFAGPASEEVLRVRLKSNQTELNISGVGLRVQGSQTFFQSVAIPTNDNLQIKRFHKEGHSFWLLTRRGKSQIISTPFVMIEGHDLRAGAQALPQKIFLSAAGSQKMDVVGLLPVEEYIAGVIASEMPLQWPLETLKAQAVAARSYALSVMKERSRRVYHLESSILDQVFRPLVAENGNDLLVRKARQAVRETRGQTLRTAQGKLMKAFYHSDCGGRTVAAGNVWKGSANSGEVSDNACPLREGSQWTLTKLKSEVFLNVKKFLISEKLMRKNDEVVGLNFLKEVDGHRVGKVEARLQSGVVAVVSSNDFRSALGFQILKSTMFDATESAQEYVFKGQGFGHGVGLCQWGSRYLGMNGSKYDQILKHYYPLAKIARQNQMLTSNN